ncbi:uncharacterized protein SPAPADRAFT_58542 [Spathaspora passalidarum NRRL Y-27907]|uniref:Replication termination factor 2 n=1 Tax=Spathaspora passalidarum (strain NRRL Y-27907 / 11-Y1) TaxID=619300 RepID=G3AGH9_SPAPN|nr:uncharacterized protein SPAPADRAFT_58542 [Spathaspora passalidarum NRRL Y-27907]EGW35318.1 hypothetical protein SPAPADRAFT_58542 [Spathaspora passalidarum NRRL Y-27907]
MGADGGTIAKRKDLINVHSSLDKKNSTGIGYDNELTLLNSCGISAFPLHTKSNDPIVGDYKGRLYLKEKILQYLIDSKQSKSRVNPKLSHITSLKDICDVKIEWDTSDEPRIRCPITKISSAKSTYAYLRPCGCLMSSKVITELNQNNSKGKCPNCDATFSSDCDVVIVNPLGKEEYNKLNESSYKILCNQQLSHSKKPIKSKKVERKQSIKRAADSQEPVSKRIKP